MNDTEDGRSGCWTPLEYLEMDYAFQKAMVNAHGVDKGWSLAPQYRASNGSLIAANDKGNRNEKRDNRMDQNTPTSRKRYGRVDWRLYAQRLEALLKEARKSVTDENLLQSIDVLIEFRKDRTVGLFKCRQCNDVTEHTHMHNAAHGIPGTHMSGSERFVCSVCGCTTHADNNPGDFIFVLDKTDAA